jgi:hypothetical protein
MMGRQWDIWNVHGPCKPLTCTDATLHGTVDTGVGMMGQLGQMGKSPWDGQASDLRRCQPTWAMVGQWDNGRISHPALFYPQQFSRRL